MDLLEAEKIYIANSEAARNMEPSVEWKEPGFNLEKTLNDTRGPIIEIAGPTPFYKQLQNLDAIKKPIFVSNLTPGDPLYNPFTGEYLGVHGTVDFQADARKLPVENKSVGAILASCLPANIVVDTVNEIDRVVEDSGLVIWQGVKYDTAADIQHRGFAVKHYQEFRTSQGTINNYVFKREMKG
ncbi:MAG: hypothetical protein KatS3mg101_0380 [Patescibacteria group bacterium]|nr:MAG: hypothetical protein KatS3mg101_0380 [Patescibacteria group bacterium]